MYCCIIFQIHQNSPTTTRVSSISLHPPVDMFIRAVCQGFPIVWKIGKLLLKFALLPVIFWSRHMLLLDAVILQLLIMNIADHQFIFSFFAQVKCARCCSPCPQTQPCEQTFYRVGCLINQDDMISTIYLRFVSVEHAVKESRHEKVVMLEIIKKRTRTYCQ